MCKTILNLRKTLPIVGVALLLLALPGLGRSQGLVSTELLDIGNNLITEDPGRGTEFQVRVAVTSGTLLGTPVFASYKVVYDPAAVALLVTETKADTDTQLGGVLVGAEKTSGTLRYRVVTTYNTGAYSTLMEPVCFDVHFRVDNARVGSYSITILPVDVPNLSLAEEVITQVYIGQYTESGETYYVYHDIHSFEEIPHSLDSSGTTDIQPKSDEPPLSVPDWTLF